MRVKVILEASSSSRWEDVPFIAMDGAVLLMVCSIPVLVSSDVVCVAMGAMTGTDGRLEEWVEKQSANKLCNLLFDSENGLVMS